MLVQHPVVLALGAALTHGNPLVLLGASETLAVHGDGLAEATRLRQALEHFILFFEAVLALLLL